MPHSATENHVDFLATIEKGAVVDDRLANQARGDPALSGVGGEGSFQFRVPAEFLQIHPPETLAQLGRLSILAFRGSSTAGNFLSQESTVGHWKGTMEAEELSHFHPQYRELHAELLARPFPVVAGQVIVSHRAIWFTAEESSAHWEAVAALATHQEVVTNFEEHGCQVLRLGAVELRIEPHAEFTTFTVFAPQSGLPFSESAMDHLPHGWLDGIPGRIIASVEIASELVSAGDAGTAKTMERVLDFFGQERIVGGWVVERVASVWSHFRPDERGATRFLVQIHRLTSGRYGRLLQRLAEIETYRMAAMLSVPLAREVLLEIQALEVRHLSLVKCIGEMDDESRVAQLADLTSLSLAVERLKVRCGSRFSLTEDYAKIVTARIRELREEQVPGYQTIGEFFDWRLVESMKTYKRAEIGLDALSTSLPATTQLLRTSIEVQRQTPIALTNDPSPSARPPKWQSHFDVILVVVLTYCLANLLKLAVEAVRLIGIPLNSSLVTTLALPFLGYAVWRALQHVESDPEE